MRIQCSQESLLQEVQIANRAISSSAIVVRLRPRRGLAPVAKLRP